MPRDVDSYSYEELLADTLQRVNELRSHLEQWHYASGVRAEVYTIRSQLMELQHRGRQGTLDGL